MVSFNDDFCNSVSLLTELVQTEGSSEVYPTSSAMPEPDRELLCSTFSPEGRLFQVEYSLEAIKLGSTAIGVSAFSDEMCCDNGGIQRKLRKECGAGKQW